MDVPPSTSAWDGITIREDDFTGDCTDSNSETDRD